MMTLSNFILINASNPSGELLAGNYNPYLVLVSILVAILASYAALTLAIELVMSKSSDNQLLLSGGSIAMGMGIWSMHFIGMLAFSLPIEIGYDLLWTMISLLPAIGASAIALYLITQSKITPLVLVISAIFMGTGISTMHYLGMAAMKMQATINYQPFLFILSISIAIIVSLIAIIIFSLIRREIFRPKLTIQMITATVMGLGIVSMHYTGMAAARFYADYNRSVEIMSESNFILGISVIVTTLFILGTTIMVSTNRY